MFDMIERLIRFVTSLRTAAQQLLAVLLITCFGLTLALVMVYQELRKVEASIPALVAQAIAGERQLAGTVIAKLEKRNESLESALSEEKKQKYEFVKDLFEKQKELNSRRDEVDKKQIRLANQNRGHVNVIKKGVKDLIDKQK